MNTIDSLFLTLVSTVACIVLPKLLSVLFTMKSKQVEPASKSTSSKEATEVPSFPY